MPDAPVRSGSIRPAARCAGHSRWPRCSAWRPTGTLDDLELRAVRADGTTRWFAVRGRLEHDASHGAPVLIGVARDVDEEHSLQGDRAVLDGLFAVAPVGLALLDTDLRYVRVNPALAAMNGAAAAEHLGRRPAAAPFMAASAGLTRT